LEIASPPANVPVMLALPAASLNFPATTITVPVPTKPALGVNVAV